MSRLQRAFALSASDWILLVQAAVGFVVIELGLRFLGIKRLLAIAGKPARNEHPSPERMAYCVEVASRLHPLRPTCLKKSLVLYALMRRKGFLPQIMIGAAKDGDRLDAHAWLAHQGRMILGAPAPGRYSILCTLEQLAAVRPQEQSVS